MSFEFLKKCLRKLKKGKGSPDGATAEILQALPEEVLSQFADELQKMFSSLTPRKWTKIIATLIPKVVGPKGLNEFRPLSSLCCVRKLIGYIWIETLPADLRWHTFQTAFLKGRDASQAVFTIQRCSELAREWSIPLFCAQLDLKKAFDKAKHSSISRALQMKGVSQQHIAIMNAWWQQSSAHIGLGNLKASRPVHSHRGVPQGAPESPLVFTMLVDEIIGDLDEEWQKRAYGWHCGEFSLTCLAYADDVLFFKFKKSARDDDQRLLP